MMEHMNFYLILKTEVHVTEIAQWVNHWSAELMVLGLIPTRVETLQL